MRFKNKKIAKKKFVAIIKIFATLALILDLNALIEYLKAPKVETKTVFISPYKAPETSHSLLYEVAEAKEAPVTTPDPKTPSAPKKWTDGRDKEMATIASVAKEMNYSNVEALYRLAHCESRFDNSRTNTNSDKRKTNDRGIFQYNDYWHPEVSEVCARDTACATKRTIELTRNAQNASEIQWSCRGAFFDEDYNYLAP